MLRSPANGDVDGMHGTSSTEILSMASTLTYRCKARERRVLVFTRIDHVMGHPVFLFFDGDGC